MPIRHGAAFNVLAENNRKTLHDILEEAAKKTNAVKGSNEQKIGDFYASCLDETKREAEGMKPLVPELARIDKIQDVKGVQAEIAYMHRHGVSTLFGYGSLPDLKNSSMVLGAAGQGGLSLPNRDYYTKTDEKSVKLRDDFVKHVANMFQLVGDTPEQAAKNAQTVLAFQTRLAQNSRTPVELRDPTTQYHMMNPGAVERTDAKLFLGRLSPRRGRARPPATSTSPTPEFFTAVNKMLTEVPVADWKTYLRWHLITAAAPSLSSKFETENFNFFGKTLEGRKEQLPRWRRCVSATDASLGEALGQVYVSARVHAGVEGAHEDDGQQSDRCVPRPTAEARLDERRHAQAGDRQARRLWAEDRLSRQVDRLLDAQRLARFLSGKRAALQRV